MIRKLPLKSEHQKYHLKSGEQVVGASTISKLGQPADPLISWAHKLGLKGIDYRKVRDDAGDAGTVAHFLIETFLSGDEADLSEFPPETVSKGETVFLKWHSWWEQQGLSFVSAETQLVSEKYKYGGTLDILCRDRYDSLVLLDTKSSKGIWDNFFLQLAGYQGLSDENYDEYIRRRAIIRFGKDEDLGDMEIVWVSDRDIALYWEAFKAQVALHHALSRIPKRKYYPRKKPQDLA